MSFSKTAKAHYLIHVTKEDYEAAVPGSSSHCAVEVAIKRMFPEFKFISVDIQSIRWSDPKHDVRHMALTPQPIARNILEFDAVRVPGDISFYLRSVMQTPMLHGRHGEKSFQYGTADQSAAKLRKPKVKATGKRNGKSSHVNGVPTVVGGSLPPRAHMRRSFGLRGYLANQAK